MAVSARPHRAIDNPWQRRLVPGTAGKSGQFVNQLGTEPAATAAGASAAFPATSSDTIGYCMENSHRIYICYPHALREEIEHFQAELRRQLGVFSNWYE